MPKPARISSRVGLVAGAVLALLAIGTGAESQGKGHQYTVTITSMNYGRLPPGLKVGDTINWVNRDTVIHTVTARNKSFDLRLMPGKSGSTTLSTAGAIPIYCIFHPAMRATLNVSA